MFFFLFFHPFLFREEKDESRKSETPTPEVDEDGFCIRPKPDPWENEKGFYSSSDTESEDERERKIRVEIKPLSNGNAPMSASVDELRATVENLSLSPAPTVINTFKFSEKIYFYSFLIFFPFQKLYCRVEEVQILIQIII